MKSRDLASMSDRDLLAGLRIFNDASTLTPADYALTAAQTADLKAALDAFEAELTAYDQAQAAEATALNAKNQRRKITILPLARQQMKLARAAAVGDDGKLGKVGLDLYDAEPTAGRAPTSVPVAHVDYGRLKHTIYFRDSAAVDSEGKPKDARGCEIWRFTGAAEPASIRDYDFVALDTASPYTAFYDTADAGKTVFYILRWISKTGEPGEWSATVSATING